MNEVVVNHLDGENGLTNKIKDALNEAAHQFIYIGFLLKEADDLGYYREGGYDNIYDYCEENFGFGRSSTNNFIRVYRQFGSQSGIGLLDSYKAYNYSQLTEMCSMNVNQLNECNPYMTVRELRAVKKGTKPMKLEYTVEPDESPEAKVLKSSRQSGQFALYHLQALGEYLFNRFSSVSKFYSPGQLELFVVGSGCDFNTVVDVFGSVNVSIMCAPEVIEVKVNKDAGYVPYYIAYYIYTILFKASTLCECDLKPDLQISDMGKCSNCGCLCGLEDNYCSNCGFKINKK